MRCITLVALLGLLGLGLLAVGCGDDKTSITPPDVALDPDARPASSAKALTAFSFSAAANPGLTADVDATVKGDHIAVTMPHMTNVTALVATFATTGAHVVVGSTEQVSGSTPNDFRSPVTYRVIAADGSRHDYTVRVTVAASPGKEIVAYRFNRMMNAQLPEDVVATITGSSIVATVPSGTTVTALIATWSTTGSSITVDGTLQIRNVTPNDFTSPVVYRVRASDGSTRDYTVTVTIAPP